MVTERNAYGLPFEAYGEEPRGINADEQSGGGSMEALAGKHLSEPLTEGR
jgi:hypothetical protein